LQEAKQHLNAPGQGPRDPVEQGDRLFPGGGQEPVRPTILDDVMRLNQKAQAALMETLHPDEQPHVVVAGASGSAIIGTGERALVIKSGVRFGAPFAARTKAFEYESVIGVRIDTSESPAVVVIDAPVKSASCRVYWADPRDNAWRARNAIPVDPPYSNAEEGVEALRGLLEAFRERHPALPRGTERTADRTPPVVQAFPDADDKPAEEEGASVSALPVVKDRCPHCRAVLRPGWRYCPGCGAPSENASARS
jgi:hypothetical protein